MLNFKFIPLQDFIKPHNPNTPSKETIHSFSQELQVFLAKATRQSDEEFQKNEVNKFLAKIYHYDCNTKNKIDSAIYVENEAQVLIEVKSLSNKAEFIQDQLPFSKALFESILYFLREVFEYQNNAIKHIILCNPYEFYLFDAQKFLIFAQDQTIKKLYKHCDHKEGTNTKTQKFYTDLQAYLKQDFHAQLPYTHFSFSQDLSEQDLSLIYQLLSPAVLLKQPKTLDANTLNQRFYDELLYILGLQETSQNGTAQGKLLIEPSQTRHSLSNAIQEVYPTLSQEEIFTLLTAWNNRILFLALFESMLLGFKHISKPFLQIEAIPDFKTLQYLFFGVLAKKPQDRHHTYQGFENIPYLNSSLFDKIPLESEGKEIKMLDSQPLPLFERSILKKSPQYATTHSLPLLEYLFAFLHAYDFTTTPKDISDGVKQNHDKLINSAVLGLVFEKLNGYKEGSFYTPSFITSYMCKDIITQALIEKYNSTYHWEAQSLKDIVFFARADKIPLEHLSQTFLSLKICDPAVGSGHFLVSALNEMVLMAYELGFLTALPLSSTLELENDEILIKHQNTIFSYTKPTSPQEISHKIQKEMFDLKKSIIENCLFGVDINPNSCEITKLRLWIELLKYSFYLFDEKDKNTDALETLPNIDINIKCGNSLISYFPLDQELPHHNIKEKIKEYKQLVQNYKQGLFEDKNILNQSIKALLESFKKFCFNDKFRPQIQEFLSLCKSYSEKYGNYLASNHKDLALYIPASFEVFDDFDKSQAQKDFQALQIAYDNLYNLESSKPFEWRFAFPEVLDEKGEFLGFDCIIGNPPYIRQEHLKHLKPQLSKLYTIYTGTSDIYTYFFERGQQVLAKNGLLSFITSNKWCRARYGQALRSFILTHSTLLSYIDLNGQKVFESACVDTSITTLKNQAPTPNHTLHFQDSLSSPRIPILQDSLSQESFIFASPMILALKSKIQSIGTPLKDWDISIYRGVLTGYNEAFIIDSPTREKILSNCKTPQEKEATNALIKKILRGKDIKRYSYEWGGLWLIFIPWHFPNTHSPKTMQENESDLKEQFPSLYSHLLKHKSKLQSRNQSETGIRYEWYCLQRWASNYYEDFEKEKIMYPTIMAGEPRFIYDTQSMFSDTTANIITSASSKILKFIFGIQSSTFWYQIMKLFYMGGGITNEFKINNLLDFPIPQITQENQKTADQIIGCVEQILKAKEANPQSDTQDLESQIDSLIYSLYSLTPEEITIIEGEK